MERSVLVLAALLAMAPMAGVAGASALAPATAPTAAGTQSSNYDDVIGTPSDEIAVWERAAFPLRAEASAGATTVQNQQLLIDHWDTSTGSVSARYSTLGVFDSDRAIPLEFADTDLHDIGQFEGGTASVVVGKLDATGGAVGEASIPSIVDLLDDPAGTDTATFERVDTREIRSEGFSSAFTPDAHFEDASGEYVVLAAVSEGTADAPTLVDSGALDPAEDAVIVGADAVVVHDAASSVSVSDAEPGDTVTFDANANVGTNGDVHHAVALYHRETFANTETTLNVTAPIDGNVSTDDVTIESTLDGINGVVSPQAGSSIPDRVTNVGSIFAATGDGFGPTDVTTAATTLDGSAIARANASAETTLDVETYGNWTEGEYQWVHVAGTNGTALATNAGTITIASDDGGGGPVLPPPPDPGDPDIALVSTSLSTAKVAAGERFEIAATYENTGDASGPTAVELRRDRRLVDDAVLTVPAGTQETVTFTQSIDEPGAYTYSVDDTTVGTVDVTVPPAAFETSNATVGDTSVTVGDSVDVTATVENTGGSVGTHTAELRLDGEPVDTTEITLDPGASETVAFTHRFDAAGAYDVSVDDAAAGTVSVKDDGDGDGVPGFGPGAALLGLAATLLIARSRP